MCIDNQLDRLINLKGKNVENATEFFQVHPKC